MLKPYVGVTGIMDQTEANACLDMVPSGLCHDLMLGVLISSKTLQGIPNKYPHRYPTMLEFNKIFVAHPKALNIVHYNTDEPDTLPEQTTRIMRLVRQNLHGFQFNMTWPPVDLLGRSNVWLVTILQIGRRAFDMVDNSPEKLAAKVAQYGDVVEYILLDPSGGAGKTLGSDPMFTIEKMREYLQALYALGMPDVGFGVAGGLSHKTLHLVEPLMREFPNLSIDAESQLRNADDKLNLSLAEKYLLKYFEMLRTVQG